MVAGLRKLKKLKPFISFILLLVLLALVFIYAMFQGGFVSWFLFFSFLPFALYSILLFFYPMKFQAERNTPPRIYNAGDQVEVDLTITRKFPFPLLFLLIEDEMPGSLERNEMKRIFFPGFKRKLKMTYTIANVSRGEHFFKYVRLKTGDALGLLEKERRIPCEQIILVYPPYEHIYNGLFRSMFDQGGLVSGTKLPNDKSLVAGIREYIPGDRFSWIDWKASARFNEMMTKEFEARESDDVVIILDLMPSKNFESLVKFAASVARAVIRNGGQTGLFLAGNERLFIPPHGGAKQENAIFYQLAKVKPDGSRPLEKHFGDQALGGQSAFFIAITSKLSKQLIDGAGKLFGQKQMMNIFLIKNQGENMQPEETALAASAAARGVIVHTVAEQNFQTAFTGVKQA